MAWERQGSAGNSIDYLMPVAYNIETIEKLRLLRQKKARFAD
jgi:hypothetical protein